MSRLHNYGLQRITGLRGLHGYPPHAPEAAGGSVFPDTLGWGEASLWACL